MGDIRDQLGSEAPPMAGALVGVEHEYSLHRMGEPVDFRGLIHQLDIVGRRLDPGDRNAYRLRSGIALTCDGAEAEVATPPLHVGRGFAQIVSCAANAREELLALLPSQLTLEGYSTHVSASLPGDGEAVARLYARSFGPSLALLMERPQSLGIYVRPRPGRLELCGDFVVGPRLGAVVAFVAGSVRACAEAVASPDSAPRLPPPVALRLLPAVERYGWRVLRNASGCDLYALGRDARLPLEGGGEMTAQEHLAWAWHVARAALGHDLDSSDASVIDAMVSGALPLGVEPPMDLPVREPVHQRARSREGSEFGRVIDPIRRPGFRMEPVAATWDFTLLALADDGNKARRLLLLPRAHLRTFFESVDSGALDDTIRRELGSPPADRRLDSHAQTGSPAFHDAVGDLTALLPPERIPVGTPIVGTSTSSRRGKVGDRYGKAPPVPVSPSMIRPGKAIVDAPAPSRPWLPAYPTDAGPSPTPVVPPPASFDGQPALPEQPTPLGSEGAPPLPLTAPVSPPMAPQLPPPPRSLPVRAIAVLAAVAVVGVLVFVVAVQSGGGGEDPPRATPTHVSGSETSAPLTALATSRPTDASPSRTPSPVVPTGTPLPSPTTVGAAPSPTVPGAVPATATIVTPAPPAATPTPDGAPAATSTPTGATTPTPTPTALPTGTSTSVPTPLPTAAPTPRPTLLPVATPTSVPATATAFPAPTATPTPSPTRTPPATVPAATIAAPTPACTPVLGIVCP